MPERYEPPSEFLKALIDDEAPIVGGEHAAANLHQLMKMMRDPESANRDWATMLLAQEDIDTPEVREALKLSANDVHNVVRAEAILGLAQRDKCLALPFLQKELEGESVCMPLLEAVAIVAHPSLAEGLRAFAEPSNDPWLDDLVMEALNACEANAARS